MCRRHSGDSAVGWNASGMQALLPRLAQSPQAFLRKSKRTRLTKNIYVVQENFGSFRKELHQNIMHELRYQEQRPALNKHCLRAMFVSNHCFLHWSWGCGFATTPLDQWSCVAGTGAARGISSSPLPSAILTAESSQSTLAGTPWICTSGECKLCFPCETCSAQEFTSPSGLAEPKSADFQGTM